MVAESGTTPETSDSDNETTVTTAQSRSRTSSYRTSASQRTGVGSVTSISRSVISDERRAKEAAREKEIEQEKPKEYVTVDTQTDDEFMVRVAETYSICKVTQFLA